MRHLVLVLFFALTSLPAHAQTATRPIRIINPYSVGGASDTFSRIIAQKITEQTGKTVVVDNRTGAGGRIGYEAAAHSPGDGNTMVLLDATYSMLPGLFASLPWDPATDLIPTAMIAQTPFVILVKPEARFKTLPDLLAEARAHPGQLNFGSSGVGGVNHIVTEFFKSEAHINITHIPFKGMGDAAAALLGGTVDLIITASPTAMGQISGGKLRPLAVTSAQLLTRPAQGAQGGRIGRAGLRGHQLVRACRSQGNTQGDHQHTARRRGPRTRRGRRQGAADPAGRRSAQTSLRKSSCAILRDDTAKADSK